MKWIIFSKNKHGKLCRWLKLCRARNVYKWIELSNAFRFFFSSVFYFHFSFAKRIAHFVCSQVQNSFCMNKFCFKCIEKIIQYLIPNSIPKTEMRNATQSFDHFSFQLIGCVFVYVCAAANAVAKIPFIVQVMQCNCKNIIMTMAAAAAPVAKITESNVYFGIRCLSDQAESDHI